MYLPFARKWRPQRFEEIIGQEHITTTLKNAISMDRIHHAYLFAGPRGIGKTSTARILSKALNCEKGLSPTPCNKCVPCEEITKGSSMDVIEIDGASNRGIDEIRNLREAVKFSPSGGRYKVYIIDEVHMLTTEAFNALLKTLEEPPPYVKFIFATTEPHKVLVTILSRCQRFDFRRVSIKEIIAKLKEIAKEEKLDIEDDVFLYIAKSSDGSVRDAESILDQVSSFSKGRVLLKDVVESLGMIEQETLFRCGDLIINKDTKGAIHLIDEVLDSGKDVRQFLSNILEHFRNIMIVKSSGISEGLIDLNKEAIGRIEQQSLSLSQGDIFYSINVISNSLMMLKQSLPERIVLELCMIKLTFRDSVVSIEELLSRLPDITKSCGEPSNPLPERPIVKDVRIDDTQNEIKKTKLPPSNMSLDLKRVKDAWPILIKAMAVKKMSVSSYLAEGEPDSVEGGTVSVAFPKNLNLHREVLEEKNNKLSIEATLSQIMDKEIKLQFIAVDRDVKPKTRTVHPPISREELKNKEPIIDSALNIFGGKLLKMRES